MAFIGRTAWAAGELLRIILYCSCVGEGIFDCGWLVVVAGPCDDASRRTPVEDIQGDGDDPSTAMLLLSLSLCSGLC